MIQTRIQLSIPIKAKTICDVLGCQLKPLAADEIGFITTDSRECNSGDLFISLSQNPESAKAHLIEAGSKGAVTLGKGGDIEATDTTEALLKIAEHYKSTLPSLKHTVAITGSVGKTTTKEFLKEIAGTKYKTFANHGNKNNLIGLPLTILSAPKDTELLVLECGMNHIGEISRLSRCAHPDVAVITVIGTSHIGNLGSREAIAKAKCEITHGMKGSGAVVCGIDEPLLETLECRITFSCVDPNADCFLSSDYAVLKLPQSAPIKISLPFAQPHLISNLAAACAAAYAVGISREQIADGIKKIGSEHLRHRIIRYNGYTIVDDAYNASFESTGAAIGLIKSIYASRHIALLGDILELGEFTRSIHEQIGELIASTDITKLLLVGEYAEYTRRGAVKRGMNSDDIIIFPNADNIKKLASDIRALLRRGDALLIKASHRSGLWQLADLITGGDND